MKWKLRFLVGLLTVCSFPVSVMARSEVEVLIDKLVEKGILTSVEADSIRDDMSESRLTHKDEMTEEVMPGWVRRWTWTGDLRLRNEYRKRPDKDRNRQRIRFRIGSEVGVSESLKAGFRIATGSLTDPVSTNQSFEIDSRKKNFNLDQAYLTYTPNVPGVDEVMLTGGIIENPFYSVAPLVWDGDLSFDGGAITIKQDFGLAEIFTTGGLFSLDTDQGESSNIWSVQGGFSIDLIDNVKMKTAVAYHDYKNVTSTTETGVTLGSGNTTGVDDMNLLNLTGEISTSIEDIPVKLFSEYVRNTSTSEDENGFLFGLKLGKAKKPFHLKQGWEAGWFFERIEPDATFGPFADSDFGGGGTNHKGNVFYVKLATLRNSTFGIKYFNTEEVSGTKNQRDTFQLDWITKF